MFCGSEVGSGTGTSALVMASGSAEFLDGEAA